MPRSVTELSHAVAATLRADVTEAQRFASMALCEELAARADCTRDALIQQTLRAWIGKVQARFQS